MNRSQEKGFALIFTMLILILLTVVVISSVKTTTSGERTSGSYMDRTRAFQAAEQALVQGKALLMDNADVCVAGCIVGASKVVSASASLGDRVGFSVASDWDGSAAVANDATLTGTGSAQFKIALLSDTDLRNPDDPTGTPRTNCTPYSILGQGEGMAGGEVRLQTVVWLCPI